VPSNAWQPERKEQRASDILQAIRTIRNYVSGISHEAFLQETMRQDAVARQLLIVAEACDKIPEIERKLEILEADSLESRYSKIPWRAIRNMGIRIRHIYGKENANVLWDTATSNDLNDLQEALLTEYPFMRDE